MAGIVWIGNGQTGVSDVNIITTPITATATTTDYQAVFDANFKQKVLLANCVLNLPTNMSAGDLTIENLITTEQSYLSIVGDTRDLAGYAFTHGVDNTSSELGKSGSGSVTLSSAGNDITITRGAAADFIGWGNGDKLRIYNTSGSSAEYTISSIAGTVVTLTSAAPTINAYGATVIFVPNVKVTGIVYARTDAKIEFKGIYFSVSFSDTTNNQYKNNVTFTRCLLSSTTLPNQGSNFLLVYTTIFGGAAFGHSNNIRAVYSTFIGDMDSVETNVYLYACVLLWGTDFLIYGGPVILEQCHLAMFTDGLRLDKGDARFIYGTLSRKLGSVSGNGITASYGSRISIVFSTISYWTTGIYSEYGSDVSILGNTFTGNTADYSPAALNTFGNNGSLIRG